MPNKLFEYSFAGLPVVASRLPDIAEYVRHYELGICVDINADEVRDVVQAGPLKPEGSVDRLRPLSWQVQADNLRAFYRKVIARRPSRRARRSSYAA